MPAGAAVRGIGLAIDTNGSAQHGAIGAGRDIEHVGHVTHIGDVGRHGNFGGHVGLRVVTVTESGDRVVDAVRRVRIDVSIVSQGATRRRRQHRDEYGEVATVRIRA